MIVIAYILIAVLAILNAKYDSNQIRIGNYIDDKGHIIRHIIRGIILLTISVFMVSGVVQVTLLLASLSFLFWIVFDIYVNFFLGNDVFRVGEVSTIDRFLRTFKDDEKAFLFKVGLFIASIILMII